MKTEELIEMLKERGQTIATMESCTGGGVANEITNHSGASDILKFSAVTYSNEFKIKMGVQKEIIDKYTVYSSETAREMSRAISVFAQSDYGVGITGQLNRIDKNNPYGESNLVYISIYESATNNYYEQKIYVSQESREQNKKQIINEIKKRLKEILISNRQ